MAIERSFRYVLINTLLPVASVVISPLSFLITFIEFLCLWSVLLEINHTIFSPEEQFLPLLIICMLSFFSISTILTPIFTTTILPHFTLFVFRSFF